MLAASLCVTVLGNPRLPAALVTRTWTSISAAFVVGVSVTAVPLSWQVPSGAARDLLGDEGGASCPLSILWQGQNVRLGVTVGGEFVPWDAHLCVAPSSLATVQGACPAGDCGEGGCLVTLCNFTVRRCEQG